MPQKFTKTWIFWDFRGAQKSALPGQNKYRTSFWTQIDRKLTSRQKKTLLSNLANKVILSPFWAIFHLRIFFWQIYPIAGGGDFDPLLKPPKYGAKSIFSKFDKKEAKSILFLSFPQIWAQMEK